ncbi:palmitoyl-acyl carrier protein thioesterase, chloroplastic-like [Populus nigra]|uniref:palmitoyl-acyl carrier protein thioesterase, chloroplastic-like n=1 Tax=Populus nigra TaxID=3691 RepID=UPI002B268864|nr:palmitoyl-acyl carrier protein thioesterase, chloroplastic-like [Populus nigra]
MVALKGNALFGTNSVTGEQRGFISATSVTELTRGSSLKEELDTDKLLLLARSFEVDADKTATLESILNLLQETALNHVLVSGLLGDGFGATHGMVSNNLARVVTRMQVRVDEYPWMLEKLNGFCRGEVMEVDTWIGASGKNENRRDWLIRSDATGEVLTRATRTWAMMNQQTRRLSKMPEAVRAEISPGFIEKKTFQEEIPEKINKLNTNAKFTNSNLKTIPRKFLENYQLTRIAFECRRECGSCSDVVQSLCEPEEEWSEERHQGSNNVDNGDSLASVLFQDSKREAICSSNYQHSNILADKSVETSTTASRAIKYRI